MKIRLTEQDLYYLVENCVKHTINEMARHYGKDEFIAAARKKHGNRYDYSHFLVKEMFFKIHFHNIYKQITINF